MRIAILAAAFIGLVNGLYTGLKREPLIPAMITGLKPADTYEDAAEAIVPGGVMLRACILLALAAAIVIGSLWALGGIFT